MITCCKDCPARRVGCHGACPTYNRQAAENGRQRQARWEQAESRWQADAVEEKARKKGKR